MKANYPKGFWPALLTAWTFTLLLVGVPILIIAMITKLLVSLIP